MLSFLQTVFGDVRYMLSPVRLLSICLSVTLEHPTQAVVFRQYFYGIWYVGTRPHPRKILRRSSQESPSAWRVKDNGYR